MVADESTQTMNIVTQRFVLLGEEDVGARDGFWCGSGHATYAWAESDCTLGGSAIRGLEAQR